MDIVLGSRGPAGRNLQKVVAACSADFDLALYSGHAGNPGLPGQQGLTGPSPQFMLWRQRHRQALLTLRFEMHNRLQELESATAFEDPSSASASLHNEVYARYVCLACFQVLFHECLFA